MTAADRLRAAGLRVTSARLAILAAVCAGEHPGTEEITRAARERVGHLTLQAVYEALNALAGAGLVRRIEPAGSPARYESRVGDNHHHIVCRGCGTVTDCVVGHAPCLEPDSSAGFAVDEAEVTFWGLCPRCQAPTGAGGAGHCSPPAPAGQPHSDTITINGNDPGRPG